MRHTFLCLDGHTGGNPVRVIAGGGPVLKGRTMSEKRQDFLAHHDWIRTALMFEPRGHDMMSGAIFYPACSPNADASILFVETSGCLPMCGHGTIGAVTLALENGLIQVRDRNQIILDTPAGQIRADIEWDGAHVAGVRIFNVTSFLAHKAVEIHSPELGRLTVDIAYGGNFYAIIESQDGYRDLADYTPSQLVSMSPAIRAAAGAAAECVHPDDATVHGVSHVMWTGAPTVEGAHARNAVFYGERAIDRSPCGTGTSARMAQLEARGDLRVGDEFIHESVIGSLFHGRVEAADSLGGQPAIRPSIRGWAVQTGINTIFVDDRDPFRDGFQLS
ncbi:4-hydroxyproline epimerase [Maricaulis sp. D1M11]|uniref:4-hydroxyproline epimerase n=1 Tax=Maricaulis sp. D1M11 TaxID=3076117 RepID=UPI0039B4AC3B